MRRIFEAERRKPDLPDRQECAAAGKAISFVDSDRVFPTHPAGTFLPTTCGACPARKIGPRGGDMRNVVFAPNLPSIPAPKEPHS